MDNYSNRFNKSFGGIGNFSDPARFGRNQSAQAGLQTVSQNTSSLIRESGPRHQSYSGVRPGTSRSKSPGRPLFYQESRGEPFQSNQYEGPVGGPNTYPVEGGPQFETSVRSGVPEQRKFGEERGPSTSWREGRAEPQPLAIDKGSTRGKQNYQELPSFTLLPSNQGSPSNLRCKHLIGSVEHLVRWNRLAKNCEPLRLHFETIGTLECMMNKDMKQLIFIKGETGHILQGVFYPIDRKLPSFPVGSKLSLSGTMVGENRMRVFDANPSTQEEQQALDRLSFISQRSLTDYISVYSRLS